MRTNELPAMDLSKARTTGYMVYSHGRTLNHGDTKTLAGARRKAAACQRRGWTPQIVAHVTDGVWSWNETVA